MNNRLAGTLLLIAAAVCCTLSVACMQLAYAIVKAGQDLAHIGGINPPAPSEAGIAWPPAVAVIVLGVLGIVFLFKKD